MSDYTADDFKRDGEAWGGSDWQRPLGRALVAAGLLRGEYPDVTVRRYASGKLNTKAEIQEWLRDQIIRRDRWAVGRTERGKSFVAHLESPRFFATFEGGNPSRVDWIDPKPDARAHGKLMEQAKTRQKEKAPPSQTEA